MRNGYGEQWMNLRPILTFFLGGGAFVFHLMRAEYLSGSTLITVAALAIAAGID